MRILLAVFCFVLVACNSTDGKSADKSQNSQKHQSLKVAADKVSLMTFNVENLFDTKDTKNKNDETFLPLSLKKTKSHKEKCAKIKVDKWRNQCLELDWSEEVLQAKMKTLAEVIRLGNSGQGADILVFQEVENYEVLNRLRMEHLKDLGYNEPQIIDGHDKRGIDVAVMSRLKTDGKLLLHKIPFKGMEEWRKKDSRGILEVPLKLPNGENLFVYAVHLPAPYHPAKYRAQSLKFLSKLSQIKGDKDYLLAAGDFNIPSLEDKKEKMFAKNANDRWWVAHKVGCKKCKGTTYYPPKKSWSFLDVIMGSKNLMNGKGWELDKSSVMVVNQHPEQKNKSGHPLSFDHNTKKGTSDHWPLYLEIKLKN